MKELFLIRGLPGAGKSTFGQLVGDVCFAADDDFMVNGEYKFDLSKVYLAHKNCQARTEQAMQQSVAKIAVSNTFTRENEMKEYFMLANQYSYRVFSLIVENRHGNTNVHNVPSDVLVKMRERFVVNL